MTGENPGELDSCESSRVPPATPFTPPAVTPRSYIGILFDCCGVYVRVYRRPDQNSYTGRCPNCLRQVKVRVGPDGTDTRMFRAQ